MVPGTAEGQRLMRLLYLLLQFPALSETFILDEITALLDLGHDVIIAALKKPSGEIIHDKIKKYYLLNKTYYLMKPVEKAARARTSECGTGQRKRIVRMLSAALKIVKKHKIEHIHCHFGDTNTQIANIIHRATGLPYTFTMHGHDIYFKPHPNLIEWASFAKKVVTVSDHNRKYMFNRLGLAFDKVQVIPCGIDLNLFKPLPVKRMNKFTILTVGRLVPVKGLVYLLEALKHLVDQGVDFQCWVIGKGEQKKSIKKQISKSHLEKYVTLLGAKRNNQLPGYYNKADVFVLPSISEGSPTTLKESLACQVPVIATKVGGVSEIVRDYNNGFLIDPKKPAKIAEKIKELMKDRAMLELMKRNARKVVEKKFDLKKNIKSLERLFLSRAPLL